MDVRIVTGCATLDEFTAAFRSLCKKDSIFLPMASPLAQGVDVHFAIALKDGPGGVPGKVVLRGHGKISQSFPTSVNAFGRAGMALGLSKLDAMGRILLRELNAGPRPGPTLPGMTATGDSDESFDISTLVESGSLDSIKAAHLAKEALRKTQPAREGSSVAALPTLSGPALEALVSCELFVETHEGPTATGLGDERSITNVAPDVPVEGESETTQVAEVEGSPETHVGSPLETQVAGDVERTREGLPNISDGTMELDIDEEEAEDEATKVSGHPGLGMSDEELGEPTRVGVPPSGPPDGPGPADPLGITQLAPKSVLADEDLDPGDRHTDVQDAVEEVTQVPAVSKQIIARSNPAIARIPLVTSIGRVPVAPRAPAATAQGEARVRPAAAPAPAAQESAPSQARPAAGVGTAPRVRTPLPPFVAATQPREPGEAPRTMGTPAPMRAPATPPPAAAGEDGAEAISNAIAEIVVEPTIASKPLPGTSSASKTSPAARSIASLPMVSAGVVGGGTSEPPSPVMVTRNQAGLFGGLCLIAGLGFGLLLGGGGGSEADVSAAGVDSNVPRPIVIPAATRPVPADAASAQVAPVDAAPPVMQIPDAALPDAAKTDTVADSECELLLDVEPADARVLLGELLAEAGAERVPVACGALVVSVEHDEYENFSQTIEVTAGTPFPFLHHMQRAMVTVRVLSTPNKAWVQFNGEGLGKTPQRRKVPAFEPIELRVSRAGFKPHVQSVVPKEDMLIDLRLRRWGKKRRAKKNR